MSVLVEDFRNRVIDGHDTLLEYESKGEVAVEGDKERIIQVISNLLDNELKFTGNGRVVVITNKATDGKVNVSVKDTGFGIATDIMPRLFTKFASKSQRHGLGAFHIRKHRGGPRGRDRGNKQ